MSAPMKPTGPAAKAEGRPSFAAPRHHGTIGGFRLLWTGAIALPALALALAGLSAWNAVVRNETEAMVRTLGTINAQILRRLETQDAVLAALQARIDGMEWAAIAADPALPRFIRTLAEATPSVLDIGIIAPDGHLAAGSALNGPSPPASLSDHDYVRAFPPGAAAGPIFVSRVLLSLSTGRMQVHIARARRGPDGTADGGVLTSAFAPADFERFFAEIAASAGTGFLLTRDDGSVLARFPVPVTTQGERLAEDDPVLQAAATIGAGAPVAVVRSFSLPGGVRLLAVRRTGDDRLLIAHGVDPDRVTWLWLRQMAPLSIGALAGMALLLLLIARAQRRLAAEQESLARRAATAEQAEADARTHTELQARLRQTEKVAALGHLAAGVAHDFNNLLQSILVSAEALTDPRSPASTEVRDIGALILRVTERGMALTRRMLDYARRDEGPGGATDVAASLRSMQELLARSLGETYHLHVDPAAASGLRARGHPAEFETVIINLAINASDAMPEGGDIFIAVTGTEPPPAGPDGGLKPGRYLRITVTDRGSGMDEAALARAGEAFFTTRPRGQGSGLGLSMARGFAYRCGGRLELASAPADGTTVTLWLPAA